MTETEAHEKVARAERVKRVLIAGTAAAVTAVLVLQLVLLATLLRTSEANQQLLDLIEGCTNPAGECAQRGQEQTTTAVASINEISAYAAVCADRPGSQSLAEIRLCIADLIEAASD